MSTPLAFVIPVLIGLAIVLLAWPGSYSQNLGLKFALALGVGPGLVSCLYFTWSLFLRPRSRYYFLAEMLLAVFLLVLVWLARKRSHTPYAPPTLTQSDKFLLGLFVLSIALAIFRFAQQSLMQPHGIQDAWNIWNMRARFLFRGGPSWTDLFDPELYWLNHADYPFLVTAGVARAWSFTGCETTLAPMLQAGLYAVSLTGVLFFGVAGQKGWGQAALAGIGLTAMPVFVLLAGWQIADVPLALWMVAAIFLLASIAASPSTDVTPGILALFGLCAGLAAWTKNEGIPWFLLVFMGWLGVQAWKQVPFLQTLSRSAWIFAGSAPPLAVLVYLKLALAPASDLFAGQATIQLIQRILDPQRLGMIGSYLFNASLGVSPIGLSVTPILPVLMILFLLFYLDAKHSSVTSLIIPLLTVLAQGLVYITIYLITPHDLVWHLRTSIDRLIFHLTPPLLLLTFLAVPIRFDLPEQK